MTALRQFDVAAAGRALAGTRFARRLQHFASVESTSSLLLAAAANGAPEGTVYVADEQTSGRGRGGHQWHSSAGDGLYVSVLIRPPLPLGEALWISLATGLAAQRAIHETTGLDIDIRWPNDLLLGDKKCGGILVETSVEGPLLRFAVIGVGINVNHEKFPPELNGAATSLSIEAGQLQSRATLLAALLRALDLELTRLESGTHDLLKRFTVASTWVRDKHVHVAESGGYTGITDGLDAHGFLQVIGDDGVRHTVLSSGVRAA
ncbi:MAG: biotin--[acetyl-CoA-carboxylase] ligase [Acidobacteriota bacterium]|nr:biotin--[acetyl-CoA-carboxylase] ligase [Acidobacteriota bacterium]